jgi:predicted aldo/keto reductase-like oxidoreductase
MNRRNFLKSALAAVTTLPVLRGAASGREIPRRVLGHTGEKVSIVGIGGYHLGQPHVTEADSIRIVRTGIDGGINFLDNCWDYNNISEIRMGKALRRIPRANISNDED